MTIQGVLLGGLLIWLLLEGCMKFIIQFLRQDFQWLIIRQDEKPELDKDALLKFLDYSFDSEFGWVRKPNTSGTESTKSVGAFSNNDFTTSFSINERGARHNPGHEELPLRVSTYGDSFAFCRQVNDYQTWQWHLSKLTGTNVLNFGVGNYGIDQALLRLKREHAANKTEIVFLAGVPETIVRILNVWKHYFEYGNSFGFKPRYILGSEGLKLLGNPINDKKKFLQLSRYLPLIQATDYFYKNKFQKDLLSFPYSFSILRNYRRNLPLIFSLLLRKSFLRKEENYNRPWEIILKENNKYCIDLYQDESAVQLLLAIVGEFRAFVEAQGGRPVYVMLPYKNDLLQLKNNKTSYYEPFLRRVSEKVETIDVTPHLQSVNKELYINDFYGGHFNSNGNKYVAEILYDQVLKKSLEN